MPGRSSSFVGISMAPSQGKGGAESSGQNGAAATSSGRDFSSSGGPTSALTWQSARENVFRVGALWLLGFKEACQIHRAVSYCQRSQPVMKKTGQCFLLNGCLFLGSILVLQHVVVPALRWFLASPVQLSADGSEGDWQRATFLQNVIVGVCYVFWLYPIYIISFIVNIIWYNDIAKHAFRVMETGGGDAQKVPVENPAMRAGKRGSVSAKSRAVSPNNGGGSLLMQIGEQIYSVIMVSVFFLQVFVVSYVPYVGPVLNFVLLSWLYAYYCFDYKWGFAGWSLERRLHFFETNWAFFAGFGSPAVLATFFLSPFVSAGVMNILFPLFVLVATASNPEEAVRKGIITRRNSSTTMSRLPIFYLANNLTVPLLALLQPAVSTTPSSIQAREKRR